MFCTSGASFLASNISFEACFFADNVFDAKDVFDLSGGIGVVLGLLVEGGGILEDVGFHRFFINNKP